MKDLSTVLSSAITHKDEHTIEINNEYSLTCKFSLIVDYDGGKPDAYTRRHFILECTEGDNVKRILFSKESDISVSLKHEWMDGDFIAVKIKKLLSKEEEEVTEDKNKYEHVLMNLVDARKLVRAADKLDWMAFYMYKGTEEILKIVEQKMKDS